MVATARKTVELELVERFDDSVVVRVWLGEPLD
jgi:hypothetical protein